MMGEIRRYERRLLAGRPYIDPRDAAIRSVQRRLATVQQILAATIVVAWLATRLGHAPVAVVVVAAAVIASVWTLFAGGAVRDRIHATPATELASRAAHVRAVDEAAGVRYRPCRRELELVMVATRPIDRRTRRVLRREARELADRASRLWTTALHAGVAVAELPTRADGAIRWSARPRIVSGPDRARWDAYDEAMERIHDRLVHIHRIAVDLHVARQPALAEQSRVDALDAHLAREAAIAELDGCSSAHDPVTAIDDRLAAERFAHETLAELGQLR